MFSFIAILGSLSLAAGPDSAANWRVVGGQNGAPTIQYDGATIVRAEYLFWGPKWEWAGCQMRAGKAEGNVLPIEGAVPKLGLKIKGTIRKSAPNVLQFDYRIEASRALEGISGGGIQWKLSLKSPALKQFARHDPVLLEDDTGWKWQVGEGNSTLAVTFNKRAADVYFEKNQKGVIRTFLVGTRVAPGTTSMSFTLELPRGGEAILIQPNRYGPTNKAEWFRNALRWDQSPVDLSFLNASDRPAGQHGFVQARGDQLVFQDGTVARFWGGNLAGPAIFATSDKNAIKQQAHRIAQLGYNLMRLHHIDTTAWVKPSLIDTRGDDSQHWDATALDRLDWWVKCLKDEGVYVWLDLHVGRQIKAGDQIGEGWDEIKRASGQLLGFCYFNDRIRELMQKFNAAYLNHVNPYTKLAYKDEPAVMGLLITNENDLVSHYGNNMLPDKKNPFHNAIFTKATRAFAAKTGLPAGSVWHTWEPGPSKMFLADFEHRFNRAMLSDLRSIGAKVPVATTSFWGNESLFALPSLTDGDVIDVHSYGGPRSLDSNPRYAGNFIAAIGAAQVAGKPLTITEWNVAYPAIDRFVAPLYVASIASLQGWDAPMIYNYSQLRLNAAPQRPEIWGTYIDPALTGVMPAAAVAFRMGHIRPAQETYCLKLTRAQLYDQELSPTTSATIRTLVEQSRLTIGLPDTKELDWDKATTPASRVKVVTNIDQDFIPEGQNQVRSDTGELVRDWKLGIQTINTPKSQAAAGWIGGERIQLKDATFRLDTKSAVVALTSLDDQPIAASRKILVTAMARVSPSEGDRMPYLSEPVVGTISIRSKVPGLAITSLGPDGRALSTRPLRSTAEGQSAVLPAAQGTHWYLITSSKP